MSASPSGASAMASPSAPPPQPGRRSSSSGRAVATTSRGTPAAQSSRSSRKSSRASSAQCRSSSTSTAGVRAARPCRKRRQAANASSRRSPPGAPRPGRPARGGGRRPRPPPARRRPGRPPTRASAGGPVGRVGLQDAGLGLDDLGQGPEGHALAVGQAAPLPPGDQLGGGLDLAPQLGHQPALADAGSPTTVTSRGRRSSLALARAARSSPSSRSRATSGLLGAGSRATPERLRTPSARQTAPARPPWPGPAAAAVVDRRLVARQVASATSTRPAGATPAAARRCWPRPR